MQANDYEILTSDANSGISYRNAVNEIFKAIKTLNSGNTEPLNPEAFMWWVDTADETYYYLKQRNAGNSGWNVLFRYTVANGAVHAISGGAVVDLEALTTAFSEALNSKADKEALNAKANKATTLDGYGIEDAYTKEETEALVAQSGGGGTGGIRQTVQNASVDTSGFANFISAGTGLSVVISAATTNVKISAAGGSSDRVGTITTNTTITGLSANATNYIYADVASNGTVTLGSTTLAPIYTFVGTPSVANGQFTFRIAEMKGYVGNGSTAPQVYRVFLGEVVTGTSAVTSVITYALNGYYDSGYTNTLPASAVQTMKSHNLGVIPDNVKMTIKCLTSEHNYTVGDVVDNVITTNGSSIWILTPIYKTYKTVGVTSYVSANPWAVINKTTGATPVLTLASWAYKFTVQRGW
jgi:hypothetical protein